MLFCIIIFRRKIVRVIKRYNHYLHLGNGSKKFGKQSSVERMEDFCDPNPVQYFQCVIQSNPNPVALSKYFIQTGLYPKNPLIKHLTAVINAVSISISDPVEISSKSNPKRIQFWIAQSGWIAIRKPDHVQHWETLTYSPDLANSCEHGTGLGRTGSGLKRILAGSGLDRTEKIFVVSMWLFRTY